MDDKRPQRKQLRLENYDYSSGGAYFVTICTYQKQKTLYRILRRGDPCGLPHTELSELGALAKDTIREINVEGYIHIDKYVVMPNHVHLLISLFDPSPDSRKGCHYEISSIVSRYKSLVANKWLCVCKANHIHMGKIWQRSFYDHIIRCEQDYLDIWQYIDENPLKWE